MGAGRKLQPGLVHPSNAVGNGQAQAVALAHRAGHPVEALQHPLVFLRRDAGAVVLDLDPGERGRPGPLPAAKGDAAAAGGVLHRVVHQIHQQLAQQPGMTQGAGRLHLQAQVEPAVGGGVQVHAERGLAQLDQVDLLARMALAGQGVGARQGQQLVGQLRGAAGGCAQAQHLVGAQGEQVAAAQAAGALGPGFHLGLQAGLRYRLITYGIWGYALLSSQDFRQAAELGLRYLDLTYAFSHIRLSEDHDHAHLHFDDAHLPPDLRGFLVLRDAVAVMVIQRELTGTALPLSRVQLRMSAPRQLAAFSQQFGLQPEFSSPENRISFARHWLDAPLPHANAPMTRLCEQQCQALLAQRQVRSGLAGQVRDRLLSTPGRLADMEQVASELQLSSRSTNSRYSHSSCSRRRSLRCSAGVGASADEISWIQTAYLIPEVVMIPLSGFLSRLWGTQRLFLVSCAGFVLMSIATGLSSSIDMMILFRAIQGFVGGAMIPTVFAVAFTAFPPDKRVTASVVMGLIVTLAPTVGPTLGGHLTEWLSWRWLFFINVGPGLLVLLWLYGWGVLINLLLGLPFKLIVTKHRLGLIDELLETYGGSQKPETGRGSRNAYRGRPGPQGDQGRRAA